MMIRQQQKGPTPGDARREYGSRGRVGIVTPQSNPTVEPEINLLLPDGVSMLTTRCTSRGEPRQRLLDYFNELSDTLRSFDGMSLDSLGFACTASSYLLAEGEEATARDRLEQQFGYPVVTAAGAIETALQHQGVERITLACPYPTWLLERAEAYWKRRGFDVAATLSAQPDMRDTRDIYHIRGSDLADRILNTLGGAAADALLITGTGMPGLRLICEWQSATGRPAINSNLCLAWACLRAAAIEPGTRAPEPGFPLLGGWHSQLHVL